MFKKMISFSLCVLLCTQSTTLFAGPIREDTLMRPSVSSTLAPQIAPNRYVNERMSALSEKIATSATSWLDHKRQQISDASNRASEFAMPWFVYGKDQLGVAHTQVSNFIKHNKDDVVFWTIQGAAMSAVCLFVSPIEVSSTFLPYLSPNWIYKSVWAFLAGSIFYQSVVPVLSKESFYEGVSNMKQHMQEKFDDSKQKISAGSSKAVELATPWLVYGKDQFVAASSKTVELATPWLAYGKEYVMAGSEKVAKFAAPWCAYGRDKMTAGLKEAHNKARATLFPSATVCRRQQTFCANRKAARYRLFSDCACASKSEFAMRSSVMISLNGGVRNIPLRQ